VSYQDSEAVFAIADGRLLRGRLPQGKVRLVQAWLEVHREDVMADWELASRGEPVFTIEPLKQESAANPRVIAVRANEDHTLTLTFTSGEVRVFDVRPHLEFGVFRELRDVGYFRAVRAAGGTVRWPHGQDLCPDILCEEGRKLPRGQVAVRGARSARRRA